MPMLRGFTYYVRIRVPRRFRHIEARSEIWRSLGTDSLKDAIALEAAARDAQFSEWATKAGIEASPAEQMRRARAVATQRGFGYVPVADLAATAPLDGLLIRTEAVGAEPDLVKALLGGIEEERVMLSGLVAHLETLPETIKANRFKSPDQLRKWRNPRLRAVANLRAALRDARRPDDLPVEVVTHDVARLHQRWWKARIAAGEVKLDSAQREYAAIAGMIRDYYDGAGKQGIKPYSGISHADRFHEPGQKPEFSVEWITEHILAPGAMPGLNDEARDLVILIAETGCRQNELSDAPADDWSLDVPIPHVLIRPIEGIRETKNRHAKRAVPLVGAALEAALRHPQGFPRYAGTSNFSANVNKHFRTRGVFPTERHTIGGLRHSWESRLEALGLSNSDRAQLMGHSRKQAIGRAVYGDAKGLEMRWLVAQLVCVSVVNDETERAALVARLRKLLDEAKARD